MCAAHRDRQSACAPRAPGSGDHRPWSVEFTRPPQSRQATSKPDTTPRTEVARPSKVASGAPSPDPARRELMRTLPRPARARIWSRWGACRTCGAQRHPGRVTRHSLDVPSVGAVRLHSRLKPRSTRSGLSRAQCAQASPVARARPIGGGCGSCPRWPRIFSITGRSGIAAMIFSSPAPQFGHRSMSMSKRSFSAD
jgi:hypothetical protein